jgi:hypothetical protein
MQKRSIRSKKGFALAVTKQKKTMNSPKVRRKEDLRLNANRALLCI